MTNLKFRLNRETLEIKVILLYDPLQRIARGVRLISIENLHNETNLETLEEGRLLLSYEMGNELAHFTATQ